MGSSELGRGAAMESWSQGILESMRLTNLTHTEVVPYMGFPSVSHFIPAEETGLPEALVEAISCEIQDSDVREAQELLKRADISYLRLRRDQQKPSQLDGVSPHDVAPVYPAEREALSSFPPAAPTPPIHSQATSTIPPPSQADGNDPNANQNFYPAAKKRRTSMHTQPASSRLVATLVEDLTKAIQDAGEAAEQSEAMGNILLYGNVLPSLIDTVTKMCNKKSLHLVPDKDLCQLMSHLVAPISKAGTTVLNQDSTAEDTSMQEVKIALQASYLALLVMTAPMLSKTVLKEELIDGIVEAIAIQMQLNVFPAYDAVYKRNKRGTEEDKLNRSSSSKLKSRSKSGDLGVGPTVLDGICALLPHVATLLTATKLQDHSVLRLSQVSLASFAVANMSILQVKALAVLVAIFESYPEHHNSVMDEVVHLVWKVPSGKKQSRGYRCREDSAQIHLVSALILQIIQSAVRVPDAEVLGTASVDVGSKKTAKGASDAAIEEAWRGFDRGWDLAQYFWISALERWITMKANTEAAEAKAILEEVVEDFLTVMNLPEFPAAPIMLQALTLTLDKQAGLQSENQSVRAFAIELLGAVASKVKHDDVAFQLARRSVLNVAPSPKQEPSEAPDATSAAPSLCYICLTPSSTEGLLRCASCSRLCHTSCIKLDESKGLSTAWSCHVCTSQQRLTGGISGESSPEASLVLQQLVVDYLCNEPNVAASSAIRFLSSMWYKNNRHTAHVGPACRNWVQCGKGPAAATAEISVLPRCVVLEICQKLESERPLARSFDALLSRILASFKDKPVNRAKAMKALSIIVEADPSILANDRVKLEVEGRFHDTSISVREAAIELLGKHIVQRPDVAAKYYNVICDRIKDTGVSVRKRAIKIIRDLCVNVEKFEHTADASARIFSRFNDEEASIRTLVAKTLNELWFQPTTDSAAPLEEQVAPVTAQMVEVMKQQRTHQALVTVIKQSLFEESDDVPGKKEKDDGVPGVGGPRASSRSVKLNAAIRMRCELMCKNLLDSILQAQDGDMGDVKALPYLVALQAFCDVDSTLCVPPTDPARYAVTLLPYLTRQVENRPGGDGSRSGPEERATAASMVETILSILTYLLPHIRRPPQSFTESLQKCLCKFSLAHESMAVVHASIRCLCKLQDSVRQTLQPLCELLSRFHRSVENPYAPTPHAPRSLYALGLFCRYGPKHIDPERCSGVGTPEITALVKKYFEAPNNLLKLKAIQALGLISIGLPEEMDRSDTVSAYEACLAADAPPPLKIQVLKNLCEFALVSEESNKLQRPAGDAEGTGTVSVAAGAGDTVVASGPIQRHWNAVLECLLSSAPDVQQAALQLVEVALGQGIVFPVTCTAHLIALSADSRDLTSSTALRHLALINSRWGAHKFVERTFAEGFRLAYELFKNAQPSTPSPVKPSPSPSRSAQPRAPEHAKKGLARVYSLLTSTGMRQSVLNPLVKRFDPVDSHTKPDISFLVFCTDVLASLPYKLQDDVLNLIVEMSTIAHRRGGALVSELKELIAKDGPLEDQAQEAFNVMLEAKERRRSRAGGAGNSPGMSGAPAEELHVEIPEPLQEAFERAKAAGENAAAICLLLLLKSWLKATYNLTDAKCLAYAGGSKSQDHAVRKDVGELRLTEVTYQHTNELCQIVQRFQALKKLVAADANDYTGVATASPKPGGGRRRASITGGVPFDAAHQPADSNEARDPPCHSAPPRNPVPRRISYSAAALQPGAPVSADGSDLGSGQQGASSGQKGTGPGSVQQGTKSAKKQSRSTKCSVVDE